MSQDDLLVFAEEDAYEARETEFYNILIIDDEPQVHQVTRMVLRDLVYNNKKLKFFSTYSAEETKKIISENEEFALALVDVVMEEDDSGLKLVEFIRNILKDNKIRIILRTGQPGFAPEKEVIINYDINDYKEKTELSAQKLITSVISALRNYEYVDEISNLNRNLEKKVSERTADLRDANKKLQGMLEELQNDQEAGRIMQNKLLPEKNKRIQNYSFSSRLYPSMTLSGDFFDYFEINENYIGFYIADVSGHGISSAIVTVFLKNFIDNALEKFIFDGSSMILEPDCICKRLNDELLKEKLGKYLTIFYGIINKKEQKLSYINCGQYPYPFMLYPCGPEKNGKTSEELNIFEGKGNPVGLFKNPVFHVKEYKLPACFKMIMFSDGVLEILDHDSIESKNNYLHSLFADNPSDIDAVAKQLGLDRRTSFPDDLTFLTIEKTASDKDGSEQDLSCEVTGNG